MRQDYNRDEAVGIMTFWGLVIFLLIFFGWVEVVTMQTGKPPILGPQWYITGLIVMLGLALFHLLKNDLRTFSPCKIVILLGVVSYNSGHLVPASVSAKPWLEGVGICLILLYSLSFFTGTGRDWRSWSKSLPTRGPRV